MSIDPDTATIDECRDWLAEQRGFVIRVSEPQFVAERPEPIGKGQGVYAFDHPIPATLDEATKIPEEYHVEIYSTLDDTQAVAWPDGATKKNGIKAHADHDGSGNERTDEILCRFRLRVKLELTKEGGE